MSMNYIFNSIFRQIGFFFFGLITYITFSIVI